MGQTHTLLAAMESSRAIMENKNQNVRMAITKKQKIKNSGKDMEISHSGSEKPGFCFVFFLISKAEHTGLYTLFCSLHILSPLTAGPSPAKAVAVTVPQADGWKSREGSKFLPYNWRDIENSPLACEAKVSQTVMEKLLMHEGRGLNSFPDRRGQRKRTPREGSATQRIQTPSAKENPTCKNKRIIWL